MRYLTVMSPQLFEWNISSFNDRTSLIPSATTWKKEARKEKFSSWFELIAYPPSICCLLSGISRKSLETVIKLTRKIYRLINYVVSYRFYFGKIFFSKDFGKTSTTFNDPGHAASFSSGSQSCSPQRKSKSVLIINHHWMRIAIFTDHPMDIFSINHYLLTIITIRRTIKNYIITFDKLFS